MFNQLQLDLVLSPLYTVLVSIKFYFSKIVDVDWGANNYQILFNFWQISCELWEVITSYGSENDFWQLFELILT